MEACIIRIDLRNAEKSIVQPPLTALLEKGWTIGATVPVSDEGEPVLILTMIPPPVVATKAVVLRSQRAIARMLLLLVVIKLVEIVLMISSLI